MRTLRNAILAGTLAAATATAQTPSWSEIFNKAGDKAVKAGGNTIEYVDDTARKGADVAIEGIPDNPPEALEQAIRRGYTAAKEGAANAEAWGANAVGVLGTAGATAANAAGDVGESAYRGLTNTPEQKPTGGGWRADGSFDWGTPGGVAGNELPRVGESAANGTTSPSQIDDADLEYLLKQEKAMKEVRTNIAEHQELADMSQTYIGVKKTISNMAAAVEAAKKPKHVYDAIKVWAKEAHVQLEGDHPEELAANVESVRRELKGIVESQDSYDNRIARAASLIENPASVAKKAARYVATEENNLEGLEALHDDYLKQRGLPPIAGLEKVALEDGTIMLYGSIVEATTGLGVVGSQLYILPGATLLCGTAHSIGTTECLASGLTGPDDGRVAYMTEGKIPGADSPFARARLGENPLHDLQFRELTGPERADLQPFFEDTKANVISNYRTRQ